MVDVSSVHHSAVRTSTTDAPIDCGGIDPSGDVCPTNQRTTPILLRTGGPVRASESSNRRLFLERSGMRSRVSEGGTRERDEMTYVRTCVTGCVIQKSLVRFQKTNNCHCKRDQNVKEPCMQFRNQV